MVDQRALLQLSEEEEALLAAHNAELRGLTADIVDDVYRYIMSFPEISGPLLDPETQLKHRTALGHYIDSLTAGRYDAEYIEKRRHIGEVHFRIGVTPDAYMATYRKLLSSFSIHVARHAGDDRALFQRLIQAITKVAFLDIELALENYFEASTRALAEKKRLADSALRIFASTSSVTGSTFFNVLVQSMRRELDMPYIFIIELTKGLGGPHQLLSATSENPPLPETIEWALIERCLAEGTTTLIVPHGVRTSVSGSEWLEATAAESLGLVLLHDSSGRLIGLIAVADTRPLADEHRLATLLPLFSARAAMELERIHFNDHLAHEATHDALTGLPNRVLLNDRLEHELLVAQRNDGQVAVMFIDLDDFKDINDCFGHDTGDRLLQNIAVALRSTLREEDTVARYGGDEFVVVLGQIESPSAAETVVQKLLTAIAQPIGIDGQQFHAKASIGIAFYPDDGDSPQTLLRNADTALYRSKESPHQEYRFFTRDMNAEVVHRVALEDQLRLACERGEISLHYQPQFDMMSGRIVGAEALLRWQHPTRGMVPPNDFIPVAESSGLILDIGEWVIDRACQDLARWRREGHDNLRVAVNVSPRQFESCAIFGSIMGHLDRHDIPRELFEIELTESLLIANPEATRSLLRDFRAQGVSISMDDFGTGYSSLSYLKQYPIQRLKIDRSFVRDIVADPNDAAIVQAIIAMAQALDIGVIAEGIETEAQCHRLVEWGCLEAQGFYLGRPTTAAKLSQLLNLNNKAAVAL